MPLSFLELSQTKPLGSRVLPLRLILGDHFTHRQARKTKPSQLQEAGSENTASKRHLHVNLKRECNQNVRADAVIFLNAV